MATENMLQRALRRFTSSNAELESEELQRNVREKAQFPFRSVRTVSGYSSPAPFHGDDQSPRRTPGPRGRAA